MVKIFLKVFKVGRFCCREHSSGNQGYQENVLKATNRLRFDLKIKRRFG